MRHCSTCRCGATTPAMYVYADLDIKELRLKDVEPVMELLRGMGFPRYFAQSASIRVFWEVGMGGYCFESIGDLYSEIHDIEANLSGYMNYPRFSEPTECSEYPSAGSPQYIWD